MPKRVAVEEGLTPVRELLRDAGYEVVPVQAGEMAAVDAVVVTGMDDDMAGQADVLARVPVVRAEGMSAVEVLAVLQDRIGPS